MRRQPPPRRAAAVLLFVAAFVMLGAKIGKLLGERQVLQGCVVVGIVLGQAFFAWSHRRVAANKQPLLAMEVLESREEKSAVMAFLVAGSLGLAVGFLVPLYVQILQDRTPLFSAVTILPYAVAIAVAGVASVRLYDRVSARSLGMASFVPSVW